MALTTTSDEVTRHLKVELVLKVGVQLNSAGGLTGS